MPLRFIPMAFYPPGNQHIPFQCSPAFIAFFGGGRIVFIVGTLHGAIKNPGKFHSEPATIMEFFGETACHLDSWVVSFLFCPRPSWRSSRKRNRRLFSETGVMFSCGKTSWEIWMQGTPPGHARRVELMDKNPAKIKVRRWFIPTESHESETKKTHQAPNCKLDLVESWKGYQIITSFYDFSNFTAGTYGWHMLTHTHTFSFWRGVRIFISLQHRVSYLELFFPRDFWDLFVAEPLFKSKSKYLSKELVAHRIPKVETMSYNISGLTLFQYL